MCIEAGIAQIQLTSDEIKFVDSLINDLQKTHASIENEAFANECKLRAQEFPVHLRKRFNDFRNRRESEGYILIKGFPIDDDSLGDTPSHWDVNWEQSLTLREEIYQCLISSCNGEIFGWHTQENGRYLRHIVPIKSEKNEQLGGSSDVVLVWHNEEAFHPQRADLMTIMCYRNEEKAETNICSVKQLCIPEKYYQILREPRFYIKPDKSHFPENNQSNHWQLSAENFEKIFAFLEKPEHIPVIDGCKGEECFRIDEAFMEALPKDAEAQEALDWLYQHMNEQKVSVVMEPGDILLIDNRMTAHGRSAYCPNYGPKARWLRRVNITADLVKSYPWKKYAASRTLL